MKINRENTEMLTKLSNALSITVDRLLKEMIQRYMDNLPQNILDELEKEEEENE
jgi:hypothetical protein